jgi:hypothetical protein
MDRSYTASAASFEQDLLWSVLDQDAVPHILEMARSHWGMDAATAWTALQEQARLGRLKSYRGTASSRPVDLTRTSLAEAAQDYELFVEPTEGTHTRLNEFGSVAVRG